MKNRRPTRAAETVTPPAREREAALPAWAAPVICLTLIAASLVIQWPYQANGFAFDDWDYLEVIAQYVDGERSTLNYLFTPYNEHLFPAWRTWYYASWRAFGLAPAGWHLAITLAHGLGAAMLFLLLRAYVGLLPAAFGAALWAMAGIGGWENPLSWVSASDLSFGIACLLAAMVCLTHVRTAAGWRWPAMLAGCIVATVAWMSALWTLLPILVVQWLLLERRRGEPWRPRRAGAGGGGAPRVLLAPISVGAALGYFGAVPEGTTNSNVVEGLSRTVTAWELTIERMIYPAAWPVPSVPLSARTALGAVLLVAPLLIPGVNRRLVLLFLGLGLVYTLLVQVARSDKDVNYSLTMGRYFYLPVLAWCGVIAALLDAPWLRLRERARFAAPILLVLLVLHAWQQSTSVRLAVDEFAGQTRKNRLWFAEMGELLAHLDRVGQQRGRPLRLLDFTWRSPPGEFSLRQYLTIAGKPVPAHVQFVSAHDWTPADARELAAALESTELTMRWALADVSLGQQEVATFLAALDARGKGQGRAIAFPNIENPQLQALFFSDAAPHPLRRTADPASRDPDYIAVPMSLPLETLARRLFAGGLEHVRFVEGEDDDEAFWRDVLEQLAAIDQPYARRVHDAVTAKLGEIRARKTTNEK